MIQDNAIIVTKIIVLNIQFNIKSIYNVFDIEWRIFIFTYRICLSAKRSIHHMVIQSHDIVTSAYANIPSAFINSITFI